MERPQFLRSVLSWLRAGYPDGVPYGDYPPLLVLLKRQRLTDDEVRYVAEQLAEAAVVTPDGPQPISKVDAQVLITRLTEEMPDEGDVGRVADHLRSFGWPVDLEPLRPPSP